MSGGLASRLRPCNDPDYLFPDALLGPGVAVLEGIVGQLLGWRDG